MLSVSLNLLVTITGGVNFGSHTGATQAEILDIHCCYSRGVLLDYLGDEKFSAEDLEGILVLDEARIVCCDMGFKEASPADC